MHRDERDDIDRGQRAADDAAPAFGRSTDQGGEASEASSNVVPLAQRRARVPTPTPGPEDDDPGPVAA